MQHMEVCIRLVTTPHGFYRFITIWKLQYTDSLVIDYRDSYYKNITVTRQIYLYNKDPIPGKMVFRSLDIERGADFC